MEDYECFFIYNNHTIDLNCIVPEAPLEIVHLEVYIEGHILWL